MSTAEHEKYVIFILPKQPGEINFEETIGILTKIFLGRTSLFNVRWNCLNLIKCDGGDFVIYAGIVNREWEKFKLNELTSDSFKCPIFVCGLTSNKDAEIWSKILTKLEMASKLTLQKIAEECQRMLNLKQDTARTEERDILQIYSDQPSKEKYKPFSPRREKVKNYNDPWSSWWYLPTPPLGQDMTQGQFLSGV